MIGIVKEPLCGCVCVWQWSFWFHIEWIFFLPRDYQFQYQVSAPCGLWYT